MFPGLSLTYLLSRRFSEPIYILRLVLYELSVNASARATSRLQQPLKKVRLVTIKRKTFPATL